MEGTRSLQTGARDCRASSPVERCCSKDSSGLHRMPSGCKCPLKVSGAEGHKFESCIARHSSGQTSLASSPGADIELPLQPFQGTLGLPAPDGFFGVTDGVYSLVPPGPHAGNTDLREMGEGSRRFIPVWQPGGRIYTGDSHALQGDGEVNLTALETAMQELRIRVLLHKNAGWRWPIAETPTHFIPMGLDKDLGNAFRLALVNAIEFLVKRAGLTPLDAYSLCSLGGELPRDPGGGREQGRARHDPEEPLQRAPAAADHGRVSGAGGSRRRSGPVQRKDIARRLAAFTSMWRTIGARTPPLAMRAQPRTMPPNTTNGSIAP